MKSYWYLHLGLSAFGSLCAAYAWAALLPWVLAVAFGVLTVGGIAALKEWRWDEAPDTSDLAFDAGGLVLGTALALWIHPTILPGSYGVPWVLVFGFCWMLLNLAGIVPPQKKGGRILMKGRRLP